MKWVKCLLETYSFPLYVIIQIYVPFDEGDKNWSCVGFFKNGDNPISIPQNENITIKMKNGDGVVTIPYKEEIIEKYKSNIFWVANMIFIRTSFIENINKDTNFNIKIGTSTYNFTFPAEGYQELLQKYK